VRAINRVRPQARPVVITNTLGLPSDVRESVAEVDELKAGCGAINEGD
jgi:hypothetical protein